MENTSEEITQDVIVNGNPPKDNLANLYNNVKKDGYELPDYDTFKRDMSDPKKLEKLHYNLTKDGYELPDYSTFSSDMSPTLKKKESAKSTSTTPSGNLASEQPSGSSDIFQTPKFGADLIVEASRQSATKAQPTIEEQGFSDSQKANLGKFQLDKSDLDNASVGENPALNITKKADLTMRKVQLERQVEARENGLDRKNFKANPKYASAKQELHDVNKEIQSLPKKEAKAIEEVDNFLSAAGNALDTGIASVSKSLYDTPKMLLDAIYAPQNYVADKLNIPSLRVEPEVYDFNNVPSAQMEELISTNNKNVAKYKAEIGGDVTTAYDKGDYVNMFKHATLNSLESAPMIATAMLTGGESAIANGLMMTSSASTQYAKLGKENPEMGTNTKLVNSALNGVLEVVVGKYMEGVSGNVWSQLLKEKGKDVATQIAVNSFKKTLTKVVGKSPMVGVASEYAEERITDGLQQLNDISTGASTDFDWKQNRGAGLSSLGFSVPNATALYGTKAYISEQTRANVKKTNKEIINLQGQLQNPDLSVESRGVIIDNINRIYLDNKKILGSELEKLNSISENDRKELLGLDDDMEGVKSNAIDIKHDVSLNEQAKASLLAKLKEDFSRKNDRKNEILTSPKEAKDAEIESSAVKKGEPEVFFYNEAKGEKSPDKVPDGYTSIKKVENSVELSMWENQGKNAESKSQAEAKEANSEALKDVESTSNALINDIVGKDDFDGSENQKTFFKAAKLVPKEIWEGKTLSPSEAIAEAYHKSKQDGSNPELVKAVEELIVNSKLQEASPTPEVKPQAEKVETPVAKIEREYQDAFQKIKWGDDAAWDKLTAERDAKLEALKSKASPIEDVVAPSVEEVPYPDKFGYGSIFHPAHSKSKILNKEVQKLINKLPKVKINYKDIKGIGDLSVYLNNPELLNSPDLKSASKIYEDLKNGIPIKDTPSISDKMDVLDGRNRIVAQLAFGIKDVEVAVIDKSFYDKQNAEKENGDTSANENVSLGASNVGENGVAEQKDNSEQSVPETVELGASEKPVKVKPLDIAGKKKNPLVVEQTTTDTKEQSEMVAPSVYQEKELIPYKSEKNQEKQAEKVINEFGNIGLNFVNSPIEDLIEKKKDSLNRPDNGKYDADSKVKNKTKSDILKLENIKKQGYNTLWEWANETPKPRTIEPKADVVGSGVGGDVKLAKEFDHHYNNNGGISKESLPKEIINTLPDYGDEAQTIYRGIKKGNTDGNSWTLDSETAKAMAGEDGKVIEMPLSEFKNKYDFVSLDKVDEHLKNIGKGNSEYVSESEIISYPKEQSLPNKEVKADVLDKTDNNSLKFTTHTGEEVSGEKLTDALNKVANDWIKIQKGIKKQDKYASHVSEKTKEKNLSDGLEYAEKIRRGENIDNFTVWQRVNAELTGETVALLPKKAEVTLNSVEEKTTVPTTKERITERVKLSDAKIEDVAEKLKKFFPKANINLDDYKTNGLSQDAIIDIVAKIAKSIAKGSIVTQEHISEAIKQFKEHFGDEVDSKDVEEKINSVELSENPKVNQSTSKNSRREKSSEEVAKELGISHDEYFDLKEIVSNEPSSGVFNEYLSAGTIADVFGDKPTNDQQYEQLVLSNAVSHGNAILDKTKVVFGDNYIAKTLEFLQNAKLGNFEKAVVYAALENNIDTLVKENPRSTTLKATQELIYADSQANLRNSSKGLNAGRLRRIHNAIKLGYDVEKLTGGLFTSTQKEAKSALSDAIPTGENLNKASEKEENIEEAEAKVYTKEEFDSELKKAIEATRSKNRGDLSKKGKDIADRIRRLKLNKDVAKADLSLGAYDLAIEAIAQLVEKGSTVAQAIKNVLNDSKFKDIDANKIREDILGVIKAPKIREVVKKALIDAGFSREITVTKNKKDGNGNDIIENGKKVKIKEQKQVLDWNKLTGRMNSVEALKANVEAKLKEQGYTDSKIDEISKELETEYKRLSEDVADKALTELERRNQIPKTPNRKSDLDRLVDYHNKGLFGEEAKGYERLLNKIVGVTKREQLVLDKIEAELEKIKNLREIKIDGKLPDAKSIQTQSNHIAQHIRNIIAWSNLSNSPLKVKAMIILGDILGVSRAGVLGNLYNIVQNLYSGKRASILASAKFNIMGYSTPELNKAIKELQSAVRNDALLNRGADFGDNVSPFSHHSIFIEKIKDYINKTSSGTKNKILIAALNTLEGRLFLNIADSFFKSKIVNVDFVMSAVDVLTTEREGHTKMSKKEAVEFVSEALTGVNLEKAKVLAKQFIKDANKVKEGTLLENESNINRLAFDIVRENLTSGNHFTMEEINDIYKSAMRSGGFNIGHEANNPISVWVKNLNNEYEKEYEDAMKEKDYDKATWAAAKSLISKNIANPYVGGGMNWAFIETEAATPIGLLSGGYKMYKNKPIDLLSDVGIKKMKEDLANKRDAESKLIRGVWGTAVTITGFLAYQGIKSLASVGDDDEENKRLFNQYLREHPEQRKAFDKFSPEVWAITLAQSDERLSRYLFSKMGYKTDQNDNVFLLVKSLQDDGTSSWGVFGALLGQAVSTPGIWRVGRDVKRLKRELNGEENNQTQFKVTSFLNGWFKGGYIDYIGKRPGVNYDLNKMKKVVDNERSKFTKETNGIANDIVSKKITEEQATNIINKKYSGKNDLINKAVEIINKANADKYVRDGLKDADTWYMEIYNEKDFRAKAYIYYQNVEKNPNFKQDANFETNFILAMNGVSKERSREFADLVMSFKDVEEQKKKK